MLIRTVEPFSDWRYSALFCTGFRVIGY